MYQVGRGIDCTSYPGRPSPVNAYGDRRLDDMLKSKYRFCYDLVKRRVMVWGVYEDAHIDEGLDYGVDGYVNKWC